MKKILLIGIVAGSFVVFISSNDEINFIQSLIAFGERFIFLVMYIGRLILMAI